MNHPDAIWVAIDESGACVVTDDEMPDTPKYLLSTPAREAAEDLKAACRAMGDAIAQLQGTPIDYGITMQLVAALELGGLALEKSGGVK